MPKVKSYQDKHRTTKAKPKTTTQARNTTASVSVLKNQIEEVKQRTDEAYERMTKRDNWQNAFIGLNVANKDKRTGGVPEHLILTEDVCEDLYSADQLAAKIVDLLPEDMLREGFKITSPDLSDDDTTAIFKAMENMGWREKFKRAMSWARLYGGAGIVLGVDDGAVDSSEPLNWEKISRFNFLTVLSMHELEYDEIQDDPTQPNYGMPSIYRFQPKVISPKGGEGFAQRRIHASRIIRFDGAPLPRTKFIQNKYWSDSVFARLYYAIGNYSQTHDSVASLMLDFAQAVFKIKNLSDILSAADGKEMIQERIEMIELSRSLINAVVIADEEEFKRETTPLTGIDDILRKMEERLVAYSGYPHTILLGESPGGGIGERGKSELRDYYDFVSRKQKNDLQPKLEYFLKAIMRNKSGPMRGREVDDWSIEFNPLWQDDMGDIVEQRSSQATIDETYIRNQVLTPDEVALARFGSGEYSHETRLLFEREENPDDLEADPDTDENNDPVNP